MTIIIKYDIDSIDQVFCHTIKLPADTKILDPLGEIQNIVDERLIESAKLEVESSPLINKNNIMKIVRELNKYDRYYLSIRAGSKLIDISSMPDNVDIDLLVNDHQFVYTFQNMSDRSFVTIRAKLVPDTENELEVIKSNLSDLEWRQYFLRKSLLNTNSINKPQQTFPDIMTAAQLADYLQVSTKSIRTWTSEGRIPVAKIKRTVRYVKEEIDSFLETGKLAASRKNKRK